MTNNEQRHDADTADRQSIGFLVEFTLVRGLSHAAQRSFQRRLEDHLAAQELQHGFSQLQGAIWDEHTDLVLEDQADFLCWALVQPEVCAVEVSEPQAVDSVDDIEGPRVRMQVYTPNAIAGAVLYSMGDISAEVFIRALGGFVVPHLAD
jgi:hypothetical protein